ncbi:Dcp2, box A domain-containing protein [Crepidotus variabilis]|uniref:Dcp2, box A domain-containing protein n=1 Tax=Crepidotus variabilis TaxID=179855 RepID=A0A9P6ECE1_9AGAR|nr:Dcp2, box A domain-containing protein [Crepidotus variabilis]
MASSSSSSPEFSAAEPVVDAQSRFSYKDATQDEVLEDLSSRFILNLPDEELNSLERICFQVEQAHWFYEDFIREENHKLPSMPLKKFSEMLFHACPLLHQWSHDHEEAFKNFMQYKTRVPVCGAIMLNDAMDKCVLVKGWKASSNWGFPKGKINETEPTFACAIREVLEETGYNIAGQIDPANVIELSIKEQKISLFFVPGVPEDFNFQTRTRKEISQIAWFKLSDLPTWRRNKAQPPNKKFYLISPFIGPLKAFINETKNRNGKKAGRQKKGNGIIDEVGSAVPQSNGRSSSGSGATPEVANHIQNKKEGEWGPELTRLFSGLSAISKQGVNDHASNERQENGNTCDSTSASDEPSDSSLDSPVATRAQPATNNPSRAVETTSQSPPVQSRSPTNNVSSTVPVDRQVPTKSSTTLLSSTSPASPRRSSATADISPYLSRRTEIPVSAKTLQHLQLLETVADESARMAPVLAARAAYSTGQPPPPGSSQQFPYDMGAYPPMHPGLSSSAAGFHPRPQGSTLPYNNYPDPLQSRSRTSQAFHRPTMHNPGSMSMNQNNLLAVINGARGGPIPQNYPVNHPSLPHQLPNPSGAYLLPRQPNLYPMSTPAAQGFGSIPGIPSSGPPQTLYSQPSLHTLLGQLPGPNQLPMHSYAPPNPNFPAGITPAPPAGHNHLLSILNGRSIQAPTPSNISQL